VILAFRDFFEPMTRELKPSAKLLNLNGKHVRITGFMAQMEEAPRGAFIFARDLFSAMKRAAAQPICRPTQCASSCVPRKARKSLSLRSYWK
jgi:hypothetical protein